MEPSVGMMLPKGIVINTTSIYKEVASYPVVPAAKIWEYWHVYTTTNKRLQDPTARRLENFWWHVLGSDRRHLSGRILAGLYEDISVGPTVIPIQGPPNRWEGPDVPPLTKQMILSHVRQQQDAQQGDGPVRRPPPLTKRSDNSIKGFSSSASKPPPQHPILKKTKGPTSSGPRPTARFVSPPESADEDGFRSSASTATTGLEPQAFKSKRKPPAAMKKIVASSTASKRRPAVTRRMSPQSPIPSADRLRNGDTAAGTRAAAGQPRPVSPIPERMPAQTGDCSEVAEDAAKSPLPRPSAKALGKRPAVPLWMKAENGKVQHMSSTTILGRREAALQQKEVLVRSSSVPRAAAAVDTVGSPGAGAMPLMVRTRSHNGDAPDTRLTSQGLFTGATASTTKVAAQGTIIDQTGSLPRSSVLDGPSPLGGSFPSSKPYASSLLDSRLTPTPPAPSASVPMGRSRSQLTLLLEREKTPTKEKPCSKGSK
ncbi:hypothetical protein RJ55_06127 [Drechmeria coniospora]|nr:hypothetical protein RJ55_06127 [Drechmeria coniospora]